MVKNGDPKLPEWGDMDYLDSEYVREGVEIYLSNPDAGPEIWHQKWYEHHQKLGWKYGKVYDPIEKTTPVFMEFNHLPTAKRNSDVIFHAVVSSLTTTEEKKLND